MELRGFRALHSRGPRRSVGSFRGLIPWVHSVGSLRGFTPRVHSVGSSRGFTLWVHPAGSSRGFTPWAHSVGSSRGFADDARRRSAFLNSPRPRGRRPALLLALGLRSALAPKLPPLWTQPLSPRSEGTRANATIKALVNDASDYVSGKLQLQIENEESN